MMVTGLRCVPEVVGESSTCGGSPIGTLTFLLTDVEGATALWEAQPVGAENCVVAGHAAFRYSLMSPSQRVDLTTRSRAGGACAVDSRSALGGR
jgi:hypothetical protein